MMLRVWMILLAASTAVFAIEGFISADSLQKVLGQKDVVILDVGSEHAYKANHIPGALHTDMMSWRVKEKYHRRLRSVEDLEKYIRSLGINNDTTVVIYGHNRKKEVLFASYIAMAFYTLGHDKTTILNGGYGEWEFDDSRPVEGGKTALPTPGTFKAKPRKDLLVDLKYVKSKLNKIPMLEARQPDYYFGRLYSNGIKRAGHIPGAVSAFWKNSFTEDEMIVSQKELKDLFYKGYGIQKSKTSLLYCTGGLEASMNWYVAHRELGLKNLKVYDASLREWGNLDDTPMVKFRWEN